MTQDVPGVQAIVQTIVAPLLSLDTVHVMPLGAAQVRGPPPPPCTEIDMLVPEGRLEFTVTEYTPGAGLVIVTGAPCALAGGVLWLRLANPRISPNTMGNNKSRRISRMLYLLAKALFRCGAEKAVLRPAPLPRARHPL
jgi:hypothetical protein